MDRYKKVFEDLKKKSRPAFIPFCVVGDPDLKTSITIAKTYIKAGADILEIGIPFSDPIADGPVNQLAAVRANKNNIGIAEIIIFIKEIRKKSEIPIGILCYANSVLSYGLNKFCKDIKNAGADSVLIADMPPEESTQFLISAKKYSLGTVFIISQLSDTKRIKHITKITTGFIYLVSRLGVTGTKETFANNLKPIINKIKKETSLPILVGFGIATKDDVKSVRLAGADGAICGSALVKIIEKNLKNKSQMQKEINKFIINIRKGLEN